MEPGIRENWEIIKNNPFGDRDIGCAEVHLMLAGFAIENLCKGFLVRNLSPEDRRKIAIGDFPKVLDGHNVLHFVKDDVQLPLTQQGGTPP